MGDVLLYFGMVFLLGVAFVFAIDTNRRNRR